MKIVSFVLAYSGAHILYEGYCIVIDLPMAIAPDGGLMKNSAKKMTLARRRQHRLPNPPHVRPTKKLNENIRSILQRFLA